MPKKTRATYDQGLADGMRALDPISSLLTDKTITDEQILDLLIEARANRDQRMIYTCTEALWDEHTSSRLRAECRARCAEIINARNAIKECVDAINAARGMED